MLDCISIEEARSAADLRVVVTAGWGNPWVESAKGILKIKGLTPRYVDQHSDLEALKAWTGQTSAPVVAYGNEAPLSGWAEIIHFAERMAPSPPLIPVDERDRMMMFGICLELAGEDGFGWNRRLMMFRDTDRLPPEDKVSRETVALMKVRYNYNDEAAARADARCAQIVGGVADLLKEQDRKGSPFLVGDRLSAADIYWAAFSLMLDPLPDAHCPLPTPARIQWQVREPVILDRADPILLRHRNFILDEYIGLPLIF